MNDKGAIVGVGVTPMGKIYDRTTEEFAAEAVHLALDNAGLELHHVDGMLIQTGVDGVLGMGFQNYLGLMDLKLFNYVSSGGAGAASMVQYAVMAIDAGLAEVVACVFADRPLTKDRSAGEAYKGRGVLHQTGGYVGLLHAYGYFGANSGYALAARQHMETYGTTYDHFGHVAVSTRRWAALNPLAQHRVPITMEDHHRSRWVVAPLRLLDCTLVSNGGVAVIVTSSDRARDLRQKPVYIQGMGQGHFGDAQRRGREPMIQTGLKPAAETAYQMAGVTAGDIDACQLYDCYTYTVIVSLEDAGFCEKGEGGPFVADGKLGPGGALPTNTGGGQLSGYYMWGMTPLSEAVIQLQGNAGERQLEDLSHVFVSGNGGLLSYHACLVLGSDRS
jgi:acetyl-CoA acetyltransferase